MLWLSRTKYFSSLWALTSSSSLVVQEGTAGLAEKYQLPFCAELFLFCPELFLFLHQNSVEALEITLARLHTR